VGNAPVTSSLSAVAYHHLKAEIIGCSLLPGTILAAQQIAERLQMSRTPVHEALKALSRDGLVRVVPRVGYIVTPVAASDIDEIFALRLSVEGLGAALAAERITEGHLAPVLMLTAFSQQDLVERARDAGAMAYLVKPFSKADLVPAIELAASRFAEVVALTGIVLAALTL